MRSQMHARLRQGYEKEILREIRGLRYFDDADILFNWEDTLKGVPLRTMKKVVNLAKMRRLYKRADGHEREDGGEVRSMVNRIYGMEP